MTIVEYLVLNVSSTSKGAGGGGPAGGNRGYTAVPRGPGGLPQLSAEQRRDNAIDIAWALINSTEFLFRH
jgi:hypothetical protein